MNTILLIIKGFIVGIGKVIPGVSGSLLAFSLGIYEDAINSINNFFKDIKYNILFLGKIGIGVVFAILLGSKLIIYMINNYYLYTMIFFIGLICGTIPYILNKVKINKKRDYIYVIMAIILVAFITIFRNDNIFSPSYNLFSYLYIILLGFLDATTMIIPGISGTATFMLLGVYDFVLNIFSNPFKYILYSCLFGVGIVLGIILVSKFISFMINKHHKVMYLFIIGFSLSSIFYLFYQIIEYISYSSLIPCCIILIIGFILSNKLSD